MNNKFFVFATILVVLSSLIFITFYFPKANNLDFNPKNIYSESFQYKSLGAEFQIFESNDPIEDGNIVYFEGLEDYTRNNTSNQLMVSATNLDDLPEIHGRAYIEWDISNIPDGATIIDVDFVYHGYDESVRAVSVYNIMNKPSQSDNQVVFDDCGDGVRYSTFIIETSTNQEIDLGSSAVSDLQNMLSSDWFSIGIIISTGKLEFVSGGIYAEEYSSANPKPTLVVKYTGLPELVITAPSSVQEENNFQVTITSNELPVQDVIVNFTDDTYNTNSDGIVNINAPSVEVDTPYQITAEKTNYQTTTRSITVTNEETPPENPQLVITAPSSVQEEHNFQVTITSNGLPVQDVIVNFTENTFHTDEYGSVTLFAPEVEIDTDFYIYYELTGYLSGSQSITVMKNVTINPDPEEIDPGEFIFGIVTDNSGNVINSCLACSANNKIGSETQCIFTNEFGEYNISLSAGSYFIQASKQGYVTNTSNIVIMEDQAFEKNFTLEKEQETPNSNKDENQDYIEYTIQEKASEGKIGASISINDIGEESIIYYQDELKIEMFESSQEKVTLTIDAPNDTDGTIIAIYIGQGTLGDLDNIILYYDGEILQEYMDTASFFSPDDQNNSSWLRVKTIDGLYALVYIPHFSKHTITITSIFEVVSEIIVIVNYILVCIAIAVIIIAPIMYIDRNKK